MFSSLRRLRAGDHRRFPVGIIVFCFLTADGSAPSSIARHHTFIHVKDLRELSLTDAAALQPVRLEGVVTTLSGWKNSFFLYEAGVGISVDRMDNTEVHPGDRVRVEGTSGAGLFAPVALANHVTVLGSGKLPRAPQATYADLLEGKQDSQWVELQGVVHSAHTSESWGHRILLLEIDAGGGLITARVQNFPDRDFGYLVDATVKVQGVCGTNFNGRRQFVGLRLFVPSLSEIRIEAPQPPNPFAIPASKIEALLQFESLHSQHHRVKVSGTATYQDAAENTVYLQSKDEGIVVEGLNLANVRPGARFEVVGFVAAGSYAPVLRDAVARKIGDGDIPLPRIVTADNVLQVQNGFALVPYDDLLVQLNGELIDSVNHVDWESWLIKENQNLFEARIKSSGLQNPSVRNVQVGSHLQLTGICVVEVNQSHEPRGFHILLRSPRDVVVLSNPWWTTSHLAWLAGFLVVLSLSMLAWIVHIRPLLASAKSDSVRAGPRLCSRFRAASRVMAILGGSIGLFVLWSGWASNGSFLRGQPGYPTMQANIALGLLLAGLSLWLGQAGQATDSRRRWAELCAGGAALIGTLAFLQYLFGINLHDEQILFRDDTALIGAWSAGRMPLATAISLLGLGSALLLSGYRRFAEVSQCVAVTVGSFSLVILVGYLYDVRNFSRLAAHGAIGIHTAAAMILLCCGLLLSHPNSGLMTTITSSAPGGVVGRRLMPAAVFIPIALGWLRWQGQMKGLYDTNFGLALFESANVVVFSLLIWITGELLNRLDRERSRVEESLGRSEAELRSTFDQAAVGIAHVSPAGLFLRVNQRLCEIVEYSEQELLTKNFAELTHPDDLAADWEQATALLRGEIVTYSMDKRYLTKNQSLVWIRLTVSLARAANGDPDHFISVIEDISGRKAAERRFSLLFDAAPSALVMTATDGLIMLVNSQAEKLFRYRREELVGQPIEILLPDRFRSGHSGCRSDYQRTPEPQAMGAGRDLFGLRKDGSEVPVEIELNPISSPEGNFILSSVLDITERRISETRLKRSLDEKQALLQEVHHRVKNNLSIISSLLAMQADLLKDQEALAQLEDSQRRVLSMAMIHELLYAHDDMTSIDLAEYARELVVTLFSSFSKGELVTYGLDVTSTRLSIEQAIPCGLILNELLTNSLKYAYPDGEGRIVVRIGTEGNTVSMTVSDKGVGLPFDFDRSNCKSLGMTLIDALTNQLEGQLEIGRRPGTSFTVHFAKRPLGLRVESRLQGAIPVLS